MLFNISTRDESKMWVTRLSVEADSYQSAAMLGAKKLFKMRNRKFGVHRNTGDNDKSGTFSMTVPSAGATTTSGEVFHVGPA